MTSWIKPENEEFLSGQFKSLVSYVQTTASGEPTVLLTVEAGPNLAMNLEFAYLRSQELWKDFKDKELADEFQKLLDQIKKRKVTAQLESMEYEIKSAEKSGDKKWLAELMAEFSKISKKLQP